jgi:HD superfamily phosphohydrolase
MMPNNWECRGELAMPQKTELAYRDALYGDVTLPAEIADLVLQPIVQRLRRIRLSNIDSLSMPGIANISRFEHALGAAHLARELGLKIALSREERILVQAAALLHDTAITPFGHLVEEALAYVGSAFDHEAKWSVLLAGEDESELGGIGLQIYRGRVSGLRSWFSKTFGQDAPAFLSELVDAIKGLGKFGACIVGDMDLDNLDNVVRVAFHMGLNPDPKLPIRVAAAIRALSPNGSPVFDKNELGSISEWLSLREQVYSHLMLAIEDFAGKLMLLYATVHAFKAGIFGAADWKITDEDFLAVLLSAKDKHISATVDSWVLGNTWDVGPLLWMDGPIPSFAKMYDFSEELSRLLGRTCFGYRIKDKRKRRVTLAVDSGETVTLGENPSSWLIGFGSPKKFTTKDISQAKEFISKFFGSEIRAAAETEEPTLFGAVGLR